MVQKSKLLKHRTKQTYLKDLGYYGGKINNKLDEETRAACMEIQKDLSEQPVTRLYTISTNKLLVSAHRVHRNCVRHKKIYFKPQEFKCECGGKYCNGFPVYLSEELLENLMKVRLKYNKPITITSGMRCKPFNDSLVGSSQRSRHLQGKAVDFYIQGICDTAKGREEVCKYWMTLNNSNYSYCNTPWMGNAVHCDVR